MVFKTTLKIHFDEADPAGIAFSGGLFTKIHRCFEDYIESLMDPNEFFFNQDSIFPLRHNEAEYLKPLLPLQTYAVEIAVIRLSESSFQMEFKVLDQNEVSAIVRSTHVCCSAETFKKKPIPDFLRAGLQNYLRPE